jgi:hypothetical protein
VFLKAYATTWRDTILKWKAEPPISTPPTEEKLFQLATRLFEEGKNAQKYALDHAGDIHYLRTTAAIHEQLRLAPAGQHAAESLLMAGQAYEILNDPVLWPIHEMYYETCIRQSSHSPMALKCFQKFEESVYFGYSGSGGTSIPDDVQAHLNELKELATVKGGSG